MKRLLLILILTLSFQTLTKADDIRDFQIEGISIGDSALDFFSKKENKDNKWEYPNKKFYRVQNDGYDFFKTYDAVDLHYKSNDSKYIIHSISGILFYTNNIEKCYSKMNQIIKEINNTFSKKVTMSDKDTFKHSSPKNIDGKSIVTQVSFTFSNGDDIDIACYDYSKIHGSQDHLNLKIATQYFDDWLNTKAYK
jgi:hypothetical protein